MERFTCSHYFQIKNNEGVKIMSEPLTTLLREISHGRDEMGTYHRKYNNNASKEPEFAQLVVELSSGANYSTTDTIVSEQFFKTVDYEGEAATGLDMPTGEHGYESCGHWHTFTRK
jgi:hypothetical protein